MFPSRHLFTLFNCSRLPSKTFAHWIANVRTWRASINYLLREMSAAVLAIICLMNFHSQLVPFNSNHVIKKESLWKQSFHVNWIHECYGLSALFGSLWRQKQQSTSKWLLVELFINSHSSLRNMQHMSWKFVILNCSDDYATGNFHALLSWNWSENELSEIWLPAERMKSCTRPTGA